MRRTTFDERVRRAMNAFFQNEPDGCRPGQLAYTGDSSIRIAEDDRRTEAADRWLGALRSVFLFLPGTFGLYYLTLATAEFWADLHLGLIEAAAISFWYLATGFMIYAGVGSLTQVRNLAVPAVVMAAALALVAIAQVFPVDQTDLYFGYSIYLLPLVLIAAKLVQAAVCDRTEP